MRQKWTWIVGGWVIVLSIALNVQAQSLVIMGSAPAGLDQPMQRIDLRGTTADDALIWWAQTSGVNLIVSWNELEAEGFDSKQPVILQLHGVSARTVLKLLMVQIFASDEVLAEANPQYIRIRTRQHANHDPVVKIYTIGDLIHSIPNFKAPSMDLTQVLSNSEDSSGSSMFKTVSEINEDRPTTKSQRAQMLVDSIQKTIYPDVWDVRGGDSSIKYYEGRLIITAPEYVHERIGIPDAIDLTHNSIQNTPRSQWKSGDADAFPPGYRNYVGFGSGSSTSAGSAAILGPRSWQSSVANGSANRYSSYSSRTSDAAYYAQPYHRRAIFGGSNGVASVRAPY
jgi:hypothetical protein